MEERKRPEAPRASSGVPGYQTLRVGSHVVAQVPGTDQSAPVWKPGNVSSWDREQGYTVVFRDGSFMPLATCLCFSVQRLSRASALSPGTPVLVPAVPESQVAFLAGVVVSCDQHTAQIVFGTQGKDWEWVQVEPGNTVPGAVRHVNGFLASLSVSLAKQSARPAGLLPIRASPLMLCAAFVSCTRLTRSRGRYQCSWYTQAYTGCNSKPLMVTSA